MGIGGGIITKKLLFAVLLIASLSLGGIADASAAEASDNATKSSNTKTFNEDINIQSKNQNDLKTSTTTQKTVDNSVNSVQTTDSSKTTSSVSTSTSTPTTSTSTSVSTSTTSTSSPTGNTVTTPTTVTKLDPNGQYAAYGTKKYVKKYKKKYKKKVTYKRYKKVYKKYKYGYKTYKYVTYKKYKSNGKYYYKKVYKYKKVRAAYSTSVTKTYYKPASNYSGSVNDSNINSLSSSLTKNAGSEYEKGSKIFNWVRDNINYSFYYNTKYGASNTLKYKKGNCVDQSHLLVSLARSSGLQARYAHGNVRFSSGKTYGHVWAQIGINGKWYNADATSSRNTFGYMSGTVLALKGIYNSLPF